MMKRQGKRWVRILKRVLGSILLLLSVFLLSILGTVDYTHYSKTTYYKKTINRIDSLEFVNPLTIDSLMVGWSKANITPEAPCNLAGYGNRGSYESVLDSIYTKVIILDNGNSRMAIVSLDLIMVHPELERQLDSAISSSELNLDGVYYTATHTHSSVGNWGKSLGVTFVMGDYRQDICNMIIDKTLNALNSASKTMDYGYVAHHEVDVSGLVHNRLVFESPEDGMFRMVVFKKENGEKCMLCTYAAHPTILSEKSKVLSNDYVGYLIGSLEQKFKLDMAVFAAGAVGSHGPSTWTENADKVDRYGHEVANRVSFDIDALDYRSNIDLGFSKLKVDLGEPQLRSRYFYGYRLKTWTFQWLLGNVNSQLKFLKIGEIILVGTPCDFSGEILKKITTDNKYQMKNVIITSFNGGYLGYAIPSKYYQIEHSETHEMNWFGPYTGDYFGEVIVRSIGALKQCNKIE